MERYSILFMGFDLAANPLRPTGWAVIDEGKRVLLEPEEIFSDREILDRVSRFHPEWVAIDAPLSFPEKESKMRLCDRELGKFGSPALSPLLLGSLTRRGILLHQKLKEKGQKCIEVYPRATQRILGIETPGRRKSGIIWRSSLQRGLSLWIENIPLPEEKLYSSHILDALLCAYTAYSRWKGNYQELGDEKAKVVVPHFKEEG